MTEKIENKLENLKDKLKDQKNKFKELINEQDEKFEGLNEQQNERLERALEMQREDFNELFNEQKEEYEHLIMELERELTETIESQQNKIQELEREIKANRKDTLNELDTTANVIKDEFLQKHQSQQEYIRKLEQNFERSVKKIINNIEHQKTITDERIQSLKEDFSQENHELTSKIEDLRGELDTLKISYTINEKKLLEKVKDVIRVEVKNAVKGHEKETLMNVWIDELKEIANDFDELKQQNPEEFELKIKEITSTIEFFREKLET
jgi:chromosome segregation ATPase